MKVLDMLVAHLQLQGFTVYPYLDDLLLKLKIPQQRGHYR